MKFSKNKLYVVFVALGSLLLLTQQSQAAGYSYGWINPSHNLTQHHEDWRQFELTAGQARSRVNHTLVNYLLGKTVDQYLDFGAEDNTGRKSSKRLKLRLNHHRAMLVYQHSFF